MSSQAFHCPRCLAQPPERFTIFEPTDDRLVAYPELNVLHVHFGRSAHTDDVCVAQARFHLAWLKRIVAQYPDKTWFFITDMTRKDDSDFTVDEAKEIYKQIRHHPKLVGGVIYGSTYAMKMFINVLFHFGGTHTTVVDTLAEAEQHYQAWWERSQRTR